MNLKNAKIYKLTCSETGKVYFGSTTQQIGERKRFHNFHKNCACKDFINPMIEIVEKVKCETKEDLFWRERYYIENNRCVNTKLPILSDEERLAYQKKKQKKNNTKKVVCECGIVVLATGIYRHRQTKKHKLLFDSI